MIEKISDFNELSGVLSPLLPLIYTDHKFSSRETDGAFVQKIDGEYTVAFSVKNSCVNMVKTAENADLDEINTFLRFMHAKSVVSDLKLGDDFVPCTLMSLEIKNCDRYDVQALSQSSVTDDYKAVFGLLDNGNGDFYDWFPSFSKRINHGDAAAVYVTENGIPVSCAVSPAIYSDSAIIGGVFTDKLFRNKGFASLCVKGLLMNMSDMNVKSASLWCEEHNIEFYKKLGFLPVGQVYIREEF